MHLCSSVFICGSILRALCVSAVMLGAGCERGGNADSDASPAASAGGLHDQAPPPGNVIFTDVTEEAGIDFVHVNGAEGDFLLPEIMGGGAGFFDSNGNGDLDIYLVQSGYLDRPGPKSPGDPALANTLYRNNGDGTFTDVTDETGVGDTGYGMGCAAGDFANNGHIDLYVTNLGPNVLYRNNGDGTFTDATEVARVGDPGWSTSAAFVDINANGWLDLFITNYVAWQDTPAFTERRCYAPTGAQDYCSPLAYDAPAFDTLYRNDGDGTFDDISSESGIREKPGTGLGVVCTDLTGNGITDIYVANDQMPSFAWINDGTGRFTEQAVRLGVAVDERGMSQAGMGVDAADVNNNGRFDLLKVHLHRETHILYENQGDYFDDATTRWGLAAPTRPYTGFGAAFFDYDLDGLLDIFIANGRVLYVTGPMVEEDIYAEPNQLLRQTRPGWFEDVTHKAGNALAVFGNSRAAAFGDYDNDGSIDILIGNCGGSARLLRNDAERRGGFLTIRVLDENGRDAYGAHVQVDVGGKTRTFEVRAAYSYCASNDPRVHVGLGGREQADLVTVQWPDGTVKQAGPFPADSFITIRPPADAMGDETTDGHGWTRTEKIPQRNGPRP